MAPISFTLSEDGIIVVERAPDGQDQAAEVLEVCPTLCWKEMDSNYRSVMGGRFRTTVPAAIAFSRWPARRLRCRGTKVVGPDRRPEFRDETYDGQLLGLRMAIVLIGEVRESKIPRFRPKS